MDLFVTMRWSCVECALAMNTCIHAIMGLVFRRAQSAFLLWPSTVWWRMRR